jgi:hypothetical protein
MFRRLDLPVGHGWCVMLCLYRTLHEDNSDHNLEGSARLWLGGLNLALGTIGI